MGDHGIRNLEQLQEDDGRKMPRSVTIVLVTLGTACVVFAGLALGGRSSQPKAERPDPLGELVSHRGLIPGTSTSARPATDLPPPNVPFPPLPNPHLPPTTPL